MPSIGISTASCSRSSTSGGIPVPSFTKSCSFRPRGEPNAVWRRPRDVRLLAGVVAVVPLLALPACTPPQHSTSAAAICHRHFSSTTLASDTTVATVRFAGGPRPHHLSPGPLDAYPDHARVVRCLVPNGPDSADVVDIVVSVDKAFVRWTQRGADATTRIIPLP